MLGSLRCLASIGPKKKRKKERKKETKRSKKWKGKAQRPSYQSCFTGKAVPDLLSTATSRCRTRGNLSSRSANSARSHVAVSIPIIYKVTIRNWVSCHGSRLSPQRLRFLPWTVDADRGGHSGRENGFPRSTSAIPSLSFHQSSIIVLHSSNQCATLH